MVVDPRFEWRQESRRHQVPWDQTIVYELHVRGYTKLHPKVPKKQRGTFAGLCHKDVISYIKALGVTSVELLPVFTFVNDRLLLDKGLTDYWGYNTIGFFAPDPRYAAVPRAALQEFKEMIARYHDAGIEVILDVVYNHTSEGNELGPTLSFKGIDNASYYRLMPDKPRYYINDTGTGNTVNLSHAARDADGHRQPALLGAGNRSRWLPFRSRHDSGARAERIRSSKRVFENVQPGSGARHGEADRGAVGHRPGRLSGRRISAGLGGVERQISRHSAQLLERRRHCRRVGAASLCLGGHFQSPRTQAVVEREFCDGARWVHAQRSGQLQRKTQRSEQRKQSGRQLEQSFLELRRRRADAGSGDQCAARQSRCATCWRRCCCRKARR